MLIDAAPRCISQHGGHAARVCELLRRRRASRAPSVSVAAIPRIRAPDLQELATAVKRSPHGLRASVCGRIQPTASSLLVHLLHGLAARPKQRRLALRHHDLGLLWLQRSTE